MPLRLTVKIVVYHGHGRFWNNNFDFQSYLLSFIPRIDCWKFVIGIPCIVINVDAVGSNMNHWKK